MRCSCCLHLLDRPKAPHLGLCLTPVVVSGESSYKEHLGSDALSRGLPKGGGAVSPTILHITPRHSGSSLPERALQAGASTMALALASAFLAFGLTLVWATISSEVVRTLTQRRLGRSAGTGISTTSRRALNQAANASS